jgi:mannose-6-phosphate isomerase-like protein (cupin superfamily)
MQIIHWEKALESAVLDPAVGIRIAKLTADTQEFCLYATELLPGKKVGAHYHGNGTEIYQILKGKGTLYTGEPAEGKACKNIQSNPVKAGDCFNINANTAHQLVNTGDESLVLIFGCSPKHLSTDRTIVDTLY